MLHLIAVKQHPQASHKGFTLIETLVTIILIGIVSAIAAPGMIGFLSRSKVISSTGDLQGLFQEAQKSAIRDSETCRLSLPTTETKSSDATNDKFSVSMSCLSTGRRELDSIQVRHNLDAVSPDYAADPTIPVDLFDFRGSTEDSLTDNFVLVLSNEDNENFQKCIVISDGLGLVRVGNYPNNQTNVTVNLCTPSS